MAAAARQWAVTTLWLKYLLRILKIRGLGITDPVRVSQADHHLIQYYSALHPFAVSVISMQQLLPTE
jgi:hypothetical protein